MYRIITIAVLLLGLQLPASPSLDTVVGQEGWDTTENWGMEPEFGKNSYYYYYKCCATPKKNHYSTQMNSRQDDCDDNDGSGHDGGYGCVYGDSKNMSDAKSEALRNCYSRYHKSCYVRFCKKFKRH